MQRSIWKILWVDRLVKPMGVTAAQNTITISTNDLTVGVYFVRIQNAEGSSAYKVIKAE